MTVRVYRSSDSGAPTLSGQVGSLIALLDACLVNGYGSQSSSGWAKEFTGTNLAAYRAASGNRYRLRIDDTGAQEARMLGYESMSGISAGLTNGFPTDAQVSGGLYLTKSSAANSTARGWVLVATATAFYLLVQTAVSDWLTAPASSEISQMFFGDFTSFKTGDTFNTLIISQAATGANTTKLGANWLAANSGVTLTGHYVVRGYDGSASAKNVAKRAMYDLAALSPFGRSTYPSFPDVVSSDMVVSPIAVIESDSSGLAVYRGILPGLWAPLHSNPGSHGDTLNGSGATSGKSFQLFNCADTTTVGRALLEISDTW